MSDEESGKVSESETEEIHVNLSADLSSAHDITTNSSISNSASRSSATIQPIPEVVDLSTIVGTVEWRNKTAEESKFLSEGPLQSVYSFLALHQASVKGDEVAVRNRAIRLLLRLLGDIDIEWNVETDQDNPLEPNLFPVPPPRLNHSKNNSKRSGSSQSVDPKLDKHLPLHESTKISSPTESRRTKVPLTREAILDKQFMSELAKTMTKLVVDRVDNFLSEYYSSDEVRDDSHGSFKDAQKRLSNIMAGSIKSLNLQGDNTAQEIIVEDEENSDAMRKRLKDLRGTTSPIKSKDQRVHFDKELSSRRSSLPDEWQDEDKSKGKSSRKVIKSHTSSKKSSPSKQKVDKNRSLSKSRKHESESSSEYEERLKLERELLKCGSPISIESVTESSDSEDSEKNKHQRTFNKSFNKNANRDFSDNSKKSEKRRRRRRRRNYPYSSVSSYSSSEDDTYPKRTHRNSGHRDLGEIARRWHLKFSGEDDIAPQEFFESLVEKCHSARIYKNDRLQVLSEVFTGKAFTWYKAEKATWYSWLDFRESFQINYGAKDDEQATLDDIHRRNQHQDEKANDYINCVLCMFNRLKHPVSTKRQLDRIYHGLRAKYW